MSTKISQDIYAMSPAFLQTIMLNMYAVNIHRERYGEKFRKVKDEIARSQYYSPEEIEEYQISRLREIVRHAYETVPYYRDVFDRLRLKPDDIRTIKDLPKIPVLTRDDVRRNLDKLISSHYRKRKLVHGHTSGTTGSPLEFYWDINTCIYTNAVDWRQKNWAGVYYGDRIAVILGRTIVPPHNTRPPFWRMNYLHNQLWLSSFHLKPENMRYYIEKLERYKPAAIEGYPSTMYILAIYLLSENRTLPLKAVLTSAETLHPIQRETIEKAFECKVFDFYGMAERVLFATECEAHAGHHLNFEFGLTEIVNDSGNLVKDGEMGMVVSTSLQNFGMPFIRYKTSDVSAIKETPCPCGRQMPLLEDVTTKAEDIIVTPDRKMISPSVLTHPFKPMHNIEKSQIIQDDIRHITIKIVKRNGYTDRDTDMLLESFRERVGNEIEVSVDFVDDIPRTNSGKFRWVVSNVTLKF